MLFGPLCVRLCVRKRFVEPSEGCVCICVRIVGTCVLTCLSVCVEKLLDSVCVVFECSKCVCACVKADFSSDTARKKTFVECVCVCLKLKSNQNYL